MSIIQPGIGTSISSRGSFGFGLPLLATPYKSMSISISKTIMTVVSRIVASKIVASIQKPWVSFSLPLLATPDTSISIVTIVTVVSRIVASIVTIQKPWVSFSISFSFSFGFGKKNKNPQVLHG